MNDDVSEVEQVADPQTRLDEPTDETSQEIAKLREEFQARLVLASLRTEAVRAGMIDLDGLRLIDLSGVRLGNDDRIIGARKLMDDLRRNKPWLFGVTSSSSAATAPVAQPSRQKSAMDMTDEEYVAARTAIIRSQL